MSKRLRLQNPPVEPAASWGLSACPFLVFLGAVVLVLEQLLALGY